MKKFKLFVAMMIPMACGVSAACGSDAPDVVEPENPPAAEESHAPFACGADVSWITQMEAEGYKFYTPGVERKPMECMQLLKDYCGVNSIRLRVWVNPEEHWNSIEDVVVKARRAHDLGLRLMIDFHMSDSWADPGKQNPPAAWAGMSLQDMCGAVAAHVTQTLNALKAAGVTPEWVQIGNETTPGMLLPTGSIDSPEQLVALNNAGYDAAKKVCPDVKVIVQLDGGHDQWRYDRMFGAFEKHGGRYDMIGMSLYPYWANASGVSGNWQTISDMCIANINHLKSRFGKPVMICEIGMEHERGEDCRQLIAKMMKTDVEGIFYWEPQTPPEYNYRLGCFENGAPTVALDAFKEIKH